MDEDPTRPQKSDRPFNRLTNLCEVMTDALTLDVEADQTGLHGKVRVIVFLEDDNGAGIETYGYDDSLSAMASLFVHMKAIFQASGKDLDFIGVDIPDTPEGLEIDRE